MPRYRPGSLEQCVRNLIFDMFEIALYSEEPPITRTPEVENVRPIRRGRRAKAGKGRVTSEEDKRLKRNKNIDSENKRNKAA